MKYIILIILVLSIIFFSGCRVSPIELGIVQTSQSNYVKAGLIGGDMMKYNAIDNTQNKTMLEESIKEAGMILGIWYEKKF